MPLTAFVVGRVLELNPELGITLHESSHEIAGHGYRWIDYRDVPENMEREHIQHTIELIEQVCGRHPVGWYTGRVSANTRRLLQKEGSFLYDSNAYNDDLPYWIPGSAPHSAGRGCAALGGTASGIRMNTASTYGRIKQHLQHRTQVKGLNFMAEPITAKQEATYEDLQKVPEHLIAEIINGELHTQPRPAVRHARAASMLDREVGSEYDFGSRGQGGWVILFEPELHLGSKPHILVPDLAGWRRKRMPELPDTAWIELTPDWVCEVISPSTASKDRILKMPLYRELGVEWLWLVDPEHKTLEAYQSLNGHWVLLGAWGENDVVNIPPFDAVGISLASLWL